MSLEQKSINALRVLTIDSINKSNSGHPGMPMGSAPMAYALWTQFLRTNPKKADWINRDRFVLSAGHGSMLLYSTLHLSGFGLSMDELKNFRQWGSKTPGHPEFGHTVGVDSTSGPLGQGIATAVGMAMAEKHLAAKFNEEKFPVVDHFTYAICGDGDLMEGVSGESSSYAGHQKLGKLVVLYDSNDITLDGVLNKSFSENVKERYLAYGWQYILVSDGNDIAEITQALELAQSDLSKPTLIEVKTVIGYGAPNKQGTSGVHGSPIGEAEAKLAKEVYNWTLPPFEISDDIYKNYEEKVANRGKQAFDAWETMMASYKAAHADKYSAFMNALSGEMPVNFDEVFPKYAVGKSVATRTACGEILAEIPKAIDGMFGGSADLFSSNKTYMKGMGDFSAETPEGKNIWFGVREFAMAALCNGIALHGGLKAYGSTFLVFSDYTRGALRLSALMNLPITQVFSHDSIAVGEDGPTHEPIEHIANLREIPNLNVIRPADAVEMCGAWEIALTSTKTPTVLVTSRQNLTVEEKTSRDGVKKGGYIIRQAAKEDAIVIATGSEVNLAMNAAAELEKQGIHLTVVSMPCVELFEAQPQAYRDSILPPTQRKRVVIEMGVTASWYKYAGLDGKVIGIDGFGASAPESVVLEKYGFTTDQIVKSIATYLK